MKWIKKLVLSILFMLSLSFFSLPGAECSGIYITQEELTAYENLLTTWENNNNRQSILLEQLSQDLMTASEESDNLKMQLEELKNELAISKTETIELKKKLVMLREESKKAEESLQKANEELKKASDSFKAYDLDRKRTEARLKTELWVWRILAVGLGVAAAR